MRPITITLVNGQSQIIPLDLYLKPFQVMVDAVVTGVATYSIQASNDDPFSGSNPTNFLPQSTLAGVTLPATGQTVSSQGVITIPVRQVFLSVTAGAGSVTFRIEQSGMLG